VVGGLTKTKPGWYARQRTGIIVNPYLMTKKTAMMSNPRNGQNRKILRYVTKRSYFDESRDDGSALIL